MATITEDPMSPEQPKPFKIRSFGRSLSSMIEEMRRQEDHEHDEELDILREMEAESAGAPTKPQPSKVMAQDSQVNVTLDIDGFAPSDPEDEFDSAPELESNAPPRKVWKKKGLKRQTRRVNIRPVRKQAPAQPTPSDAQVEDEDELNEEQAAGKSRDPGTENRSDAECEGSQSDFERKHSPKKTAAPVKENTQLGKGKRKIKANSLAHTNFCRLKIKNKNSKAKGRGRFGRKR
jgi:DNA replication regulator SLD2